MIISPIYVIYILFICELKYVTGARPVRARDGGAPSRGVRRVLPATGGGEEAGEGPEGAAGRGAGGTDGVYRGELIFPVKCSFFLYHFIDL